MKKLSSVLLALLLCGMAILGAACGKQTPDAAGTEPAATEPAAAPPSDLALVADGATSFVLVRPEDGSSAETEPGIVRRSEAMCSASAKLSRAQPSCADRYFVLKGFSPGIISR